MAKAPWVKPDPLAVTSSASQLIVSPSFSHTEPPCSVPELSVRL